MFGGTHAAVRALIAVLVLAGGCGDLVDARPSGRHMASVRVHVLPAGATAPASEVTLPADTVDGATTATLGPTYDGKIVTVPVGARVLLAAASDASPLVYALESYDGVLSKPPRHRHLPGNAVSFVGAARPGYATVVIDLPPARPRVQPTDGLVVTVWAGYSMGNGSFAHTSAYWTVPTVTYADAEDACAAHWVGVSGPFGVNQIIRIGTDSDWSNGPNYYAWEEVLPAEATANHLPDAVSPGDVMFGSVDRVGSGSSWTMTLEDLTGNWYYTVGKTYTGSVTNADWILEDCEEHNLFGTYTPSLADFGSVSFDEALQNNANPGFTGANSITMIQADAVPSPPDGDGDGFTVAWGTTIPFPPGPRGLSTALPFAIANTPYRATLVAGGASGFTWLLTAGLMPAGLTFGADGVISGTTTLRGSWPLTVMALDKTNSRLASAQVPLTLTVLANPTPYEGITATPAEVNLASDANVACSASVSIALQPHGGFSGPVTLSVAGVPAGLTATLSPTTTSTSSTLRMSASPCPFGGLSIATITAT
jgi:hypothetical protein